MEQILQAYGLLKETVTSIMMFYKNLKTMVCSPDGNIVAKVPQRNTLGPYLFMMHQDYIPQMSTDLMKENSLTIKKQKAKKYPGETITDADYANDLVLLANAPMQAKCLLHSLE